MYLKLSFRRTAYNVIPYHTEQYTTPYYSSQHHNLPYTIPHNTTLTILYTHYYIIPSPYYVILSPYHTTPHLSQLSQLTLIWLGSKLRCIIVQICHSHQEFFLRRQLGVSFIRNTNLEIVGLVFLAIDFTQNRYQTIGGVNCKCIIDISIPNFKL